MNSQLEARRKRLSAAGKATMAAGGVAAVIPVPPWAQIVAAGLVVTGTALNLAAGMSTKGARALTGDRSAVQSFAKRAARWSSKRRARAAQKLVKLLQKKAGKTRLGAKKRQALAKMKLEVLYALEAQARSNPKLPVLADDPSSVPVEVEANPDAGISQDDDIDDGGGSEDWKTWAAIGAATLAAIGIGIAATSSPSAPSITERGRR